MVAKRFFCMMTFAMAFATGPRIAAQVQTKVPPAISGAKPVTVEDIKVHGTALEGNLEGDAESRCHRLFATQLCQGEIPALPGPICLTRFLRWRRAMDPRHPRAADHRRCFRPGRERDDRRAARGR